MRRMFLLRALCVILGLASFDAHGQMRDRGYRYQAPERPEPDYTPQTYTYRNPPPSSYNRSAPIRSTNIQPRQEQPKYSWTKAPARDADLARCDELRRRYENAMRTESTSAGERKAIYQQQVRAGC